MHRKSPEFGASKESISMNHDCSVELKPEAVKSMPLLTAFVFICGIFASQRFSLNEFNIYISFLPYIVFFHYLLAKKLDIALSLLVVSLFLVSDNGAEAYSETPSMLRYPIYVSGLIMLGCLSKPQIAVNKFAFLTILSVLLLITTWSFHMSVFDISTFRRDILVLIILFVFFVTRGKTTLSLPLLFATSFGFLLGELINIGWFFNYQFGDYLNYNTLKSFVVFPFLYVAFIQKKLILAAILFFMTILVLVNYGSRMLILSFVSLLLFVTIYNNLSHLRSMLLLIISSLLVAGAIYTIGPPEAGSEMSKYKAVQFVFQFIIDKSSFDALKKMDFVRFSEHQMFFSRPVLEIIFGSGLGAGIADTEGLLANIGFNQTAFSSEELISSLYFGFHDYWIDFGLRFGFVLVIYILYLASIKQVLLGRSICGILFGLLMINTTFGTAGIIFTALVIRFYPEPIVHKPITTRAVNI